MERQNDVKNKEYSHNSKKSIAKQLFSRRVLALFIIIAMILSVCHIDTLYSKAAKKPVLNKKNVNLAVGSKVKIRIKRGTASLKVKWKSSKPSVAKITSKKSKGKNAYAVVKGRKKGTANIFASYKVGKKTNKLKCKVKVTDTVVPDNSIVPPTDNQTPNSGINTNTNQGTTPEQTKSPSQDTNNPGNQGTIPEQTKEPSQGTDNPGNQGTIPEQTKDPSQGTDNPGNQGTIPEQTKKPADNTTPPVISTPTKNPVTPTLQPGGVDLQGDNAVLGDNVTTNNDGSITITGKGTGVDTVYNIPEDIINRQYKKVIINYSVQGDFSFKYRAKDPSKRPSDNNGYDWAWGGAHNFDANSTVKEFTFREDAIPVDQLVFFDLNAKGTFVLKSVTFAEPKVNEPVITAAPTKTPATTSTPTKAPSQTSQPDGFDASLVTADDAVILGKVPLSNFDKKSGIDYGTVQTIKYYSDITKSQREAEVFFPAGYSSSKQYPVVYMLHGIGGGKDRYGKDNNSDISRIVNNALAEGACKDMLVVCPNMRVSDTPEDNTFSYENYKLYDLFLDDLTRNLMPYMSDTYNVKTGRENTAVCGFSMGGREALYIGFSRPDLFGYIGAFCPAFGIFEYTNYGVYEEGLFTESTFTLPERYFDNTYVQIVKGTEDTTVGNEPYRYHAALENNKVPHIYYEVQGGGHWYDSWGPGFNDFVRNAFKQKDNVTLMSLELTDTKLQSVDGNTCHVDMQYFTGTATGAYFNGTVMSESANCIKKYKNGDTKTSARYILQGTDSKGQQCRIFVEENSIFSYNDRTITRPTIITNSEELAWLHTADIRCKVTKNGNKSKVDFIWNRGNTKPVPRPTIVRPDETKNYNKELFTFTISIGASDEVNDGKGDAASMIHFSASSDCAAFKGETQVGYADTDTRMKFPDQVQSLSARYILVGKDSKGNDCKIFVENNGIDDNGMVTEPVIITDNPEWEWIESAPLHGTVSWGSMGLKIHMWTTTSAYNIGTGQTSSNYKVNFNSDNVSLGSNAVVNSDGSLTITSEGTGIDTCINIPSEYEDVQFKTVTIEYAVESGDFRYKYRAADAAKRPTDWEGYVFSFGGFNFDASKTSLVVNLDADAVPIDKFVLFDFNSKGKMIVKSIVFEQ